VTEVALHWVRRREEEQTATAVEVHGADHKGIFLHPGVVGTVQVSGCTSTEYQGLGMNIPVVEAMHFGEETFPHQGWRNCCHQHRVDDNDMSYLCQMTL
jgi:hypothetical protein